MPKKNQLNIVLCCDHNYIKLLVPCIISLIYNKHPSTSLAIYILETGINSYHKNKIKELTTFNKTQANVSIEFINLEEQAKTLVYKPVVYLNSKVPFTKAILYKLLIPQIFAHKDRVLLLDVDTIIKKDLSEMYNQSFADNYLVASKVSMPTFYPKIWYQGKFLNAADFYVNIFGLPSYMLGQHDHFINAGVMLFNIEKIIKDNKDKELISTFLQYQESLIWAEQDVLLKVFLDKIKDLPWIYNANVPLYEKKYKLNTKLYKQLQQKYKDVVILHFTSAVKPSDLKKAYKCLFVKDYLKYRQMSYLAFPKWKILMAKLNILRKALYKGDFFMLYHVFIN